MAVTPASYPRAGKGTLQFSSLRRQSFKRPGSMSHKNPFAARSQSEKRDAKFTFKSAPDFENPQEKNHDNADQITIRATGFVQGDDSIDLSSIGAQILFSPACIFFKLVHRPMPRPRIVSRRAASVRVILSIPPDRPVDQECRPPRPERPCARNFLPPQREPIAGVRPTAFATRSSPCSARASQHSRSTAHVTFAGTSAFAGAIKSYGCDPSECEAGVAVSLYRGCCSGNLDH